MIAQPIDLAHARDALQACDPSCSRDEWVRLAMASKAAGIDFDTFDAWSAGGENYRERDCRALWRSIRRADGIGPGSLFRIALDAGWRRPRDDDDHDHRPVPTKAANRNAERRQRETLSEPWLKFYSALSGPRGTVGEQYEVARGCATLPDDDNLRYCAELLHPSGYAGPALVALLTDTITREPRSLHFTWVCADGTKAPVDPPRRLLAGHRKAGTVCRLWPDEAVTTGLGIAEGIETALSLAHAFRPVWACVDAGGVAAFPVLPGIESLTIAADHDEAGIAAANACAERWAAAGREVYIVMPDGHKADLNDLARAE